MVELELKGDDYKSWQHDPMCQVCNDSEMELVHSEAICRGYYPSPRVETWECKKCGTEYVDTINIQVHWAKKGYLYGRKSDQVAFLFETIDGNRLELTSVSWNGLVDDYIVAWPSEEMGKVVDLLFGQPVFEHARFLYVDGGLEEGAKIERSSLGKFNTYRDDILGFFRAIEI